MFLPRLEMTFLCPCAFGMWRYGGTWNVDMGSLRLELNRGFPLLKVHRKLEKGHPSFGTTSILHILAFWGVPLVAYASHTSMALRFAKTSSRPSPRDGPVVSKKSIHPCSRIHPAIW